MLFGNATRVDCVNTSESQELSLSLFRLKCDHGDEWFQSNPERASLLIEQREREVAILNDALKSNPAERRKQYGIDSIIIVDCPLAFGGICVLNESSNSEYIHVNNYHRSLLGDNISYNVSYFPEVQIRSIRDLATNAATHPLGENVRSVAQQIRCSRFIFDHPEVKERFNKILLEGARTFINFMKFFI